MKVLLRRLGGGSFHLEVEETQTVADLKALIQDLCGVRPSLQSLLLGEVILEDKQTLRDLDVREDSALTLLVSSRHAFRYWRLLNNADNAGADRNRWAVKRLEFYEGHELRQTTEDRDKAFADSFSGPCPASKAFGGEVNATGNNGYHWSSDSNAGRRAGTSYLGYDFTEAVIVDRFRLMHYPGHTTTSVLVQGSNDKETWETVWTQTLVPPSAWPAFWEDHAME